MTDAKTSKHPGNDAPTASHALADENAAAQPDGEDLDCADGIINNESEVSELAWTDSHADFQPRILSMSTQDAWTLVRRFNYFVFRVKTIKDRPLSDLDMGVTEDETTSPEQLQAHLARFYMTVMIDAFGFWKHVVRLRSWCEPHRTSSFLAVYVVAWLADLLAPPFFIFIMAMIISPPLRALCFPPAPPSIIDAVTGGVQKPPAGIMASEQSVTAAPEHHKGEAVELEAHSFISSLSKLIMRITSDDKDDQGSPEDDPVPVVAKVLNKVSDAKSNTDQSGQAPDDDKTKEPMKHAVEDFEIQPLLNVLFDFIDTWERFANALNPTALFRAHDSRLLLAACLVPPTVITLCLSRDTMTRSLEFGLGFMFFGEPIIRRSFNLLNYQYPDWRNHIQLCNTILKGTPTNAQLTITMLRVGERNKSPVLPPPVSHGAPEAEVAITIASLDPLGVTEEKIRDTIEPGADYGKPDPAGDSSPKSLERSMAAVKRTSKRAVHVFHKIDKKRADHGNLHAQERLDISQVTSQKGAPSGPLKFPARYKGTAGYVYIVTAATTPAVGWRSHEKTLETAWVVQIADVKDLSKVNGLNFKKRHLVQWALDKAIVNGLILTTTGDERFHLSEVINRDEVFNRLIAIGNQMWEVA